MLSVIMVSVIQEGVQREVMEETGLEFQPRSLICVEVQTHYSLWVRFTVIGACTADCYPPCRVCLPTQLLPLPVQGRPQVAH